MSQGLQELVLQTSRRLDVRPALHAIYDALRREIDNRQPVCSTSGRCCRFEEYGHRLYVTTIELAAFVADLRSSPRQDWDGAGCPFQAGGLCSVHSIRPFGCRIFFCDETATQWQNDAYEAFHARLKALHEELNVPYRYVEWRQALRLLDLAPAVEAADVGSPERGRSTL
jgi:Fe-S-cluster containining protein